MPPDRSLLDATAGEPPSDENLQQLVEAETGKGTQGILRRWLASNSALTVLTSDSTGVMISRDDGTTIPTHVINVGTPAGGDLSGTYPSPTLSAAIVDALVPPGTIMAYAGTGWPTGWLPCRGEVASRALYPKLFAVIGTTYGVGDGSGTTFSLPDLQGRVVLGVSGAHALASSGGTETGAVHTHPGTHNHGLGGHTHGPGLHTHLQGTHTHDAGSHQHDISGHSHPLGSTHTHAQTGHTHDLNNHRHDLDHNHALASGVAVASGAITGVHEGPSAVVNVSATNHAHDVDLPGLGVTNSGIPSTANTASSAAVDTGAVTGTPSSGTSSAANTGTPTAATGGVTAGAASVGTPSANATDAATGTTNDDATVSAASYPGASANLAPYLSCMWIIRAG